MIYKKPVILNSKNVKMAKCGDGPSGRPCKNRA